MRIHYRLRHALLRWLALVMPILLGGACVPVSPLGTVVVGPGEEIQTPVDGGVDGDWGAGYSEAAGGGDGDCRLRADQGA